jgi:hypothetical protein
VSGPRHCLRRTLSPSHAYVIPILRRPVASDLGLWALASLLRLTSNSFEALPIINLPMERVSPLRRSYRATFGFLVGTDGLKYRRRHRRTKRRLNPSGRSAE